MEIQTAVSQTQTSLPPVPHQPPNMKRTTRTKTRRTRSTLWIPWRPLMRSSKASSRRRPKRGAGTPSRAAISSRLWRIRRPWRRRRRWICSPIRRACCSRQGWKKPEFFKRKPASGFFFCFSLFFYIFAQKREFLGFFQFQEYF
jgi:hypothetical protein